jgi:diacylglycerol kinase (ATP)
MSAVAITARRKPRRDVRVRRSTVAVVANSAKSLDGGLPALRAALAQRGVSDPQWREVAKSRNAPEQVVEALDQGVELIFVWGGDGMVQRCIDALANSKATLAIVPAGTANLFASNLGIPRKLDAAVDLGFNGERRRFDVGRMNGERFAVMAGLGFDAGVIRGADRKKKNRFGRAAYIWSATRNLRMNLFQARIDVDGSKWYDGKASCILCGNVGQAFGGIEIFKDARTDDGLLEVGVTNAEGIFQWGRTFARLRFSSASKSPYVHMTQARLVEVTLRKKVLYELDGSSRTKRKKFRFEIEPAAVNICVPAKSLSEGPFDLRPKRER